jgi:hypothetical protein
LTFGDCNDNALNEPNDNDDEDYDPNDDPNNYNANDDRNNFPSHADDDITGVYGAEIAENNNDKNTETAPKPKNNDGNYPQENINEHPLGMG